MDSKIPCSNCRVPINLMEVGAVYVRGDADAPAAALCKTCLDGAGTVKLVLKRGCDGEFKYEQFSVLEMQSKAFGKVG